MNYNPTEPRKEIIEDLHYTSFWKKRDTGGDAWQDADAKLCVKQGSALYPNQSVLTFQMYHNWNLKEVSLDLWETIALRDRLTTLIDGVQSTLLENLRAMETHQSKVAKSV